MNIRRAELKDLKRVQELNNELFELEIQNFDKFLTKEWPLLEGGRTYFENAITNGFVIVAEINNEVVGYLLGEECDIPYYDFKIAELCNMCVDEKYRKQGIGGALYNEFEKYFKSQGITHFIVTASYKNENAKAFYRRMGFDEANVTFNKF